MKVWPGGPTSAASWPASFSCPCSRNPARTTGATIPMSTGRGDGRRHLMNGGIGDLFWIFVMLTMVQPWLRQKMLDYSRVRLMHQIEKQRGSRVIILIHREETMSFLGFPVLR